MARSLPTRSQTAVPRAGGGRRAAGETLGPWRLTRLVAEGSFSQVFQAQAVPLRRPSDASYAIKRLKAQHAGDPLALRLLRREARVGREVSHPHLVPILAARVEVPPYYLVMPWLEGATLAAIVGRQGRLSVATALWTARQAAEALAALEAAGWMHADLKPANLLMAPHGHVTLLDLGLARRPHDEDASADRFAAGTPAYMAPEMVTSTLRGDIRSDLFSLGAVLFELLSGRPPFAARTAAELAEAHRRQEPPDVRRLVANVPSEVAQLLRELLAKEPLRRPQSPAEVASRLAALEVELLADDFLAATDSDGR